MTAFILAFPNRLVSLIAARPALAFLLAFAGTAALAVIVGLWIDSFTKFGLAASGLVLAVIAQGAEMYEQTIPAGTPDGDKAVRRTKMFGGGMKMLGLILLGIGGMVGLTPADAPSTS